MIERYEKELKELKEKMIRAEAFADKIPCFRDFILNNKIKGTEGFVEFASYYKNIPFNRMLTRARYISGTSRSITNFRGEHDKYLFKAYINRDSLFGVHESFGLERVLKESTVFFFDELNTSFYVEDEHIEGFLEALNNWYVLAVEQLKKQKKDEEINKLKSRLFELTGGKDSDRDVEQED